MGQPTRNTRSPNLEQKLRELLKTADGAVAENEELRDGAWSYFKGYGDGLRQALHEIGRGH